MRCPRPIVFFLLPALLFSTACRKNSNPLPGDGCISRFQPDIQTRVLAVSQYDSAKQFFEANGLSTDSLQPLSFVASPANPPGSIYYQVPTRKFINQLPVSNAYLKYDFYNGKLSGKEEFLYDLPIENNNTTGSLTPDQLRSIFLASKPDSNAYFGGLVALPPHPTHWADSCIYATLQYSDRNVFDPFSAHILIKTWSITEAPDVHVLATIIDETGKIYPNIYYTID